MNLIYLLNKRTFSFLAGMLSVLYTFSQTWSGVGGGTNNNPVYLGKYNNKLIVTGGDTFGTTPINRVASWNGIIWESLGNGPSYGLPNVYKEYNYELYAGGNFQYMDGLTNTYHIAKWNGISWASAGSSYNDIGQINALEVFNNNLYAAGDIVKIGNVNVNRIAKWNGSNWSNVGGGLTGGFMTQVRAMAMLNNKLYIAGDFTSAGSQEAFNIVSWNGSQWMSLDTGLNAYATSMVADTINNKLYVAGAFNLVGGLNGINVNYIAGWDGNNWFNLGLGLSGGILSMTMYHSELYVGGSLLIVGSDSATIYIARWDGTQWHKVIGPNNTVRSLEVYNDTLYAGGYFSSPGSYIAKYYSPLTTIREEKKNEIEYLGECFPNPTNAIAEIRYFIPSGSNGIITINNSEGKLIKTYELKKGYNNIEVSLEGYMNGMYFYTLNIDNGSIIRHKKMILSR